VRLVRRRAGLGHEQRGDEEAVLGQLEHTSLAVLVAAHDAQAAFVQLVLVLGIQAEVAVVALVCLGRTIKVGGARAGVEPHAHGLAHQRALELRDEQDRRVGVVLGVPRVREAEHVTRVLEHHVLEATAGADERHVLLAGEADAAQRPIEALVGASRSAPECVVLGEVGGLDIQRVQPADFGLDPKRRCRVPDRARDRLVRLEAGHEVADHSDERSHEAHGPSPRMRSGVSRST